MKFSRAFFRVVLPLLAGFLCYAFSGHTRLSLFPLTEDEMTRWIVQHLPDALWTFSLTALLLLIWKNALTRASVPFVLCGIFSGWIVELLQLKDVIAGTYDVMDVVLSLAGGMAAVLVYRPSVALQLPASMRAVLSVLFFGLFWIFAVATSEGPCSESIGFINKTGHPVHIVEEKGRALMGLNVFIDSGRVYDNPAALNDSEYYYLFLEKRMGCDDYNARYPGFLEDGIREAGRDSLNAWGKRDGAFHASDFVLDTFYLLHEEHRVKITRDTSGYIVKVDFWLPADSTVQFSTNIPLKNERPGRDEKARYPVYTIDYQSPHGNTLRKVISGRQFYKVLRKGNVFVIE